MRSSVKTAPHLKLITTYDSVVTSTTVPSHQQVLVPSFNSIKTMLKRERACNVPKLPRTREAISLQGEWAETLDGQPFVLHTQENNEFLFFATDIQLLNLSTCSTIYLDGTFKPCPKLYSQLFTIHGLYKGYVTPFVYVLLPSKGCTTYYMVFNILRDHITRVGGLFNPITILSDFESGLIAAIRQQFPNAKHSGCHFHFTQAVIRKVRDLGLAIPYLNPETPEISKFVQMCMALAFIPEHEVIEQFDICEKSVLPTESFALTEFISYFRLTWLNSIFSISLWNKYGMDYLHRTNNQVESWHATLRHKIATTPNIFVLIRALKLQASSTSIIVQKADAGVPPPKRTPKYEKLEQQLQKLHSEHSAGSLTTNEALHHARHLTRTLKF